MIDTIEIESLQEKLHSICMPHIEIIEIKDIMMRSKI
jgi:hypothetical protein|nr:MAG TPA: hypothetical protein [Caudoviricetes sp.]